MEQVLNEIKAFWDELPKEVKVAGYITLSYMIGEGVKNLSGLNIDSAVLTFAINVLIVFLEETKKRVDVRKKK